MMRRKIIMNKINGLSLDLQKNNIDKIKELFPEAVEEEKLILICYELCLEMK